MTTDTEALRVAARSIALAGINGWGNLCDAADTIDTLRTQLAEAQREAVSLARSLFKRHYAQEPHYASGEIEWEPFNEPASVITQIDNMIAGICAQLAEAQRELIAKEAERATMELERNNAQRQHTMQCAINKTESQRILELTSRLAEAQKNEKRYLWMRDKETSEGWDIIGRSGTPDQIDAAIDAANGGSNE